MMEQYLNYIILILLASIVILILYIILFPQQFLAFCIAFTIEALGINQNNSPKTKQNDSETQSNAEVKTVDYRTYLVIKNLRILHMTNVNCTVKDIKKQYRALSMHTHPDRVKGREEEFKAYTEAYKTLLKIYEKE